MTLEHHCSPVELLSSRIWSIYLLINAFNYKGYVGQTVVTLKKRWDKHTYVAERGGNTRFCAAIRKYSASAFSTPMLLETCSSQKEANELERFWIKEFKTSDKEFGYNMTEGGGQGEEAGRLSADAIARGVAKRVGKLNTARRLRTLEKDRPLVEAFKKGMTRRQIREVFGVTKAKVEKALYRWKERVDPSLDLGGMKGAFRAHKLHTDAEHKPMIDALLSGMTYTEVAKAFNVTYQFVKSPLVKRFRRRCEELGIEVPVQLQDKHKTETSVVDARDAPIIALFSAGKTRNEIAKELNITYAAVKQAVLRHKTRSQ